MKEIVYFCFSSVSDGKESACNAGSLVGEIPWITEWLSHSSILAWRIPWTEELGATVHGVLQSWTQLSN